MRRILKIALFILLIGLVGIQFVPTKRNQSNENYLSDFAQVYNVPDDVIQTLQTSCYDCHSNNTKYPWYNKIQPISWFMEHHIKKGKAELNFSEFGMYSKRKQRNKLKAIVSQIKDGEMPLSSYTFIQKEAKLTEDEKNSLLDYINKIQTKNYEREALRIQ